ncbi:hypothetical protein CPB86DRAFT_788479 [Serendipita vermifera]|nr:hypothetical protein CPB86DRAFT_788479 [Serendipita vermifera]
MSKILHNLRKHDRTLSVSPNPQAEASKSPPSDPKPPSLPYEIWFTIIEMAIRPDLIVDLNFAPAQIEQAFLRLRTPAYSGERAAQRTAREVESKLKVVCRTWKEIVDVLSKNQKQWVLDLKWNGTNHSVIDTNRCSRLNVDYYHNTSSNTGSIKLRQTYPVGMISIHSFAYSERGTSSAVKSILDITSFPRQLRVLHLRFTQCAAGSQLLQQLETNAIPLTTLSLFLNPSSVPLLQKDLTILTLITLFLSVPTFRKEQWPGAVQPSNTRWIFPRLRNLSLAEEGIDERKGSLHVAHPFLSQLLHAHMDQIQSLRAHPMFAELVDATSPSHWTKIPKLLALSTDFFWLADQTAPKNGLTNSAPTKSTSIRHLIQIDMDFRNPASISHGIQLAIRACTHLETVSLVGPPFRYQKPEDGTTSPSQQIHNWWDTGAMERLLQVCKDHRIELLDQEGHKFMKNS